MDLDKRDRVLLVDGLCRNYCADGRLDANNELARCCMPIGAHPVQQQQHQGNYRHDLFRVEFSFLLETAFFFLVVDT